jgi:hypothetical protein
VWKKIDDFKWKFNKTTNNSPRMKEFQKSAILEIKYFRLTFSSNIEQLESHFFCCQVTFLLLCKVVLQNVVCMYFASVPLRLRWCLICLQMWIQSFLYYMYFKEIREGRYFFLFWGENRVLEFCCQVYWPDFFKFNDLFLLPFIRPYWQMIMF